MVLLLQCELDPPPNQCLKCKAASAVLGVEDEETLNPKC